MDEAVANSIIALAFMCFAARGFWICAQLGFAMSQFLDHLRRVEPEVWKSYFGMKDFSSVPFQQRGFQPFEELLQQIEPVEGNLQRDIELYRYWKLQFFRFPLYVAGGFFLLIGLALLFLT